jgi:hypothetical protein
MRKLFLPKYHFSDINAIPADFFSSRGITGIICDIDNTLITYDDTHPTEDSMRFFASLEAQGVKIALASNNNKARVTTFNESLGYPAFYSSIKPLCWRTFKKALAELGTSPEKTAVIGDQIFTDVLGTKFCRLGMSIMVNPIKGETNFFLKRKRGVENWILKKYKHYE